MDALKTYNFILVSGVCQAAEIDQFNSNDDNIIWIFW